MIQGVIFDMDGLMFDTERIWNICWEPALAKFGLPCKDGLSHDWKINRITIVVVKLFSGL